MKDKRGPLGRTVGAVAGSIASAARRSQAAATTRVVVYDSAGHPNLLRAGTPEHTAVAGPAERLIATAREGRPRGRASAADPAAEEPVDEA
jgi:hypothetical protein